MKVTELWRYPVKGLRGEPLDQVEVSPDAPFPLDRRFALARRESGITSEAPKWALKTKFHMLMHGSDAPLSYLTPHFDEVSRILTILRNGIVEAQTFVDDPNGQLEINQYFQRIVNNLRSKVEPKLVHAKDFSFGNIKEPVVSLINLATVRQLSSVVGQKIDANRFRGNILIDDAQPWVERDWVGRIVWMDNIPFEVVDETIRCGATDVNPNTAERDLNISKLLQKNFGHMFCGVYLVAKKAGILKHGTALSVKGG
jgi:uncharacterized protein